MCNLVVCSVIILFLCGIATHVLAFRGIKGLPLERITRRKATTTAITEEQLELTENLKTYIRTIKSIHDDRLKYEQLLHYATIAEPMPAQYKTTENKVRGCLSTVHVHAVLNEDGNVYYYGDSDSVLTKGLVTILIKGLSGNPPDKILQVKKEFIGYAGFSLTAGRNNGFLNMLLHMQKQARELSLRNTSFATLREDALSSFRLVGRVQEAMERKLMQLKPNHLSIENESYKHAGHEGMQGIPEAGESHFKIRIVADCFDGVSLVNRHKLIYTLLSEELRTAVHALSIDAQSTKENSIAKQ